MPSNKVIRLIFAAAALGWLVNGHAIHAAETQEKQLLTQVLPLDSLANQAEDLLQKGQSEFQAEDFTSALMTFQAVLDIYRELDDSSAQADVLDLLGNTHLELGQYSEALAAYQQAIALRESESTAGSATSSNRATHGFQQPDVTLTGRRESGGSRGAFLSGSTPLIALIPATNVGLISSASAPLFFYIPATEQDAVVEFQLRDEAGDMLYTSQFAFPDQSGIWSISLPEAIRSQLGVDQAYEWSLSVYAPEAPGNQSIVIGWIQPAEVDTALRQSLATVPPSEAVILYSDAGLWYDALAALATAKQANPDDVSINRQWNELLESVSLGHLISEPLRGTLSPLSAETLPSTSRTTSGPEDSGITEDERDADESTLDSGDSENTASPIYHPPDVVPSSRREGGGNR